jgi:hypothetical protein
MRAKRSDIVILKGREEPIGFVKRIVKGVAHVMWWPTSTQPQRTTMVEVKKLKVVLSSEKKRGRPKKKK